MKDPIPIDAEEIERRINAQIAELGHEPTELDKRLSSEYEALGSAIKLGNRRIIVSQCKTIEGILSGSCAIDLEACKFDPDNPPPYHPPVLTIKGVPIATAGNLIAFSGQSKSGKSHGMAAIIAATLAHDSEQCDCLGFQCSNPDEKAVIYIDCEQSKDDFFNLIYGAMDRAQVKSIPDWLCCHCMTGEHPEQIIIAIEKLTENASEKHGGTLIVLIDGYADLVTDPNNTEESFNLVRRLMHLSGRIEAPIGGVLHQNAQSESLKMRGHLGSQIERKSQTVLTFQKDSGGKITVHTSQSRGAPLLKDHGSCFSWNDEKKMFLSVSDLATIRTDKKHIENLELAVEIFKVNTRFKHCELCARIQELEGVKTDRAKQIARNLRKDKYIIQNMIGEYELGELSKKHIKG